MMKPCIIVRSSRDGQVNLSAMLRTFSEYNQNCLTVWKLFLFVCKMAKNIAATHRESCEIDLKFSMCK